MAPLSRSRLASTAKQLEKRLLEERHERGHWIGELASSALSTATAVSALSAVRAGLLEKHAGILPAEFFPAVGDSLIARGVTALLKLQNTDGGWGDTDRSYSNIATSYLAIAALNLASQSADRATQAPEKNTAQHADHPATQQTNSAASPYAAELEHAWEYVVQEGEQAGLRARYGTDKTFVVPILANCAIAGLVPWQDVAPLPFELACVPQSWYRFMQMPVVSYAIPALVAIGQARYFYQPPWNPLLRWLRGACVERSTQVLEKMQPASGGYLEAIPLTSFVVMSLASTGRADHPVTQAGLRFLVSTVREDGSWPIDSNLATWITTLSLNVIFPEEADSNAALPNAASPDSAGPGAAGSLSFASTELFDWLLACQHTKHHPFTGAAPGGWGWSDLSGAVPDADDTPGALLALARWPAHLLTKQQLEQRETAAALGFRWLLDLQNRDGGWPTFCRGWGKLPFDRSGTDLTAHVLRAWQAWSTKWESAAFQKQGLHKKVIRRSLQAGWKYIEQKQNSDGSWFPLWFGNQERLDEENPLYGTAKVLFAYRDLQRTGAEAAKRGVAWLGEQQHANGSWGGDRYEEGGRTSDSLEGSIEETSLAVEALLGFIHLKENRPKISAGLPWLVEALERDEPPRASPIGFYFAKLWYYEKLYPHTFALSALKRAVQWW